MGKRKFCSLFWAHSRTQTDSTSAIFKGRLVIHLAGNVKARRVVIRGGFTGQVTN